MKFILFFTFFIIVHSLTVDKNPSQLTKKICGNEFDEILSQHCSQNLEALNLLKICCKYGKKIS